MEPPLPPPLPARRPLRGRARPAPLASPARERGCPAGAGPFPAQGEKRAFGLILLYFPDVISAASQRPRAGGRICGPAACPRAVLSLPLVAAGSRVPAARRGRGARLRERWRGEGAARPRLCGARRHAAGLRLLTDRTVLAGHRGHLCLSRCPSSEQAGAGGARLERDKAGTAPTNSPRV